MKKSLLFLAIIGLFVSCNNDDDGCTDTVVNTTSLETEYGCNDTRYNMEIDLSETHSIIKNQQGFNALVTGTCQPSIDFNTYDLVIGKKGFDTESRSIEYKLFENCETGNETLTVTFRNGVFSNAPNITYHSLIPKLKDGQQLNVEIIIIDLIP